MPSYYAQHPALKPVYGKKPVVGMESYFPPMYGTVFELAQSLQDSRTSDFKCSYEALVQKKAFTIFQDRLFTSFFLCSIIIMIRFKYQYVL